MTTNLDTARARLRAADPAGTSADAHNASARAMLERIVSDSAEPEPARVRLPRRRLVLAGVAVGAVVAVVTAGAIATPWSHGQPTNAAFALDRRPDGSIDLTVRWSELRDPGPLNQKLARLGARTVFITRSATCHVEFPFDPAHPPFLRFADPLHPDLVAVRKSIAESEQWLYFLALPRSGNLTIHPGKIPAGDTLLIPYELVRSEPGSADPPVSAGEMLVPHVPACVPTWAHTGFTDTTVRSR